MITVADTGTGIAPEILDRILSHFFTTKEQGKGTGVFQPIGIIKKSGFVDVLVSVGQGTHLRCTCLP